MIKKYKIGVIGTGMVGGPMLEHFKDAIAYSQSKYAHNREIISTADIIFIAVPTPFRKDGLGFDLTAVEDAISVVQGEKVIVLRSTVVPGTTEDFQRKYPQHKFLFNPEFLREKTNVVDFLNPDRQILGYTEKSNDETLINDLFELLPNAPFKRAIPAKEAEMVKYFGNTFLAIKVIFANQIYDLCQKLGFDYETVKEAASADKRIGPSHLKVDADGYRGYGGACFPKDTRALIQFADSQGIDLKLHKMAEELNHELTGGGLNTSLRGG